MVVNLDGKTIYIIAAAALILAAGFTGCAQGERAEAANGRGAAEGADSNGAAGMANGEAGGPDLHPSFDLTHEELEAMTDSLPEPLQTAILADPGLFLSLSEAILAEPEELLWLVDKEHALPGEYAPTDLVDLGEYAEALTLNKEGLSLRRIIMDDLLEMVSSARAEGIALPISSTYRSYEYQERLFAYWVEELGEEEARRSSAEPGTSQHQLGTTVDFGSVTAAFANTDAGRWLAREAWRYGFSLSYPEGREELTGYKYESWHFRYLGRAATEMERRFFDGVQQYFLEFWADHRQDLASAREEG